MENKKTVLLTGGSGFIGKNILESFLNTKYRILSPTSKELNVADEEAVDSYFRDHKIDIVIHGAVKPTHRNAKDLNNLFYTNTRMFFNLEKHKREYEKMLIIGSGAIYDGRYYVPKVKEEAVLHIPSDDLGFCNYVCRKSIEKSDNLYDLRVFGIFGKYEDYAIRFISNAICKSICDLPITIKQNRYFDYLFIDDLMPILDWFICNDPIHKSYNITPPESISLKTIAEFVREISHKDIPIIINKPGLGLEYSGDNSRLINEYAKARFTLMKDAISHLYLWYSTNERSIDRDLLLFDK